MIPAKQQFKEIKRRVIKLKKLQGNKYYELEEQVKALTCVLLDSDDAITLSKMQILELIGWCSSYRPKPLHVILMDLADIQFQMRG